MPACSGLLLHRDVRYLKTKFEIKPRSGPLTRTGRKNFLFVQKYPRCQALKYLGPHKDRRQTPEEAWHGNSKYRCASSRRYELAYPHTACTNTHHVRGTHTNYAHKSRPHHAQTSHTYTHSFPQQHFFTFPVTHITISSAG